jgi:hypothetical protein
MAFHALSPQNIELKVDLSGLFAGSKASIISSQNQETHIQNAFL